MLADHAKGLLGITVGPGSADDDLIRESVVVKVAHRHRHRLRVGRDHVHLPERALAGVVQIRDRVGAFVDHRQVRLPIAVEVAHGHRHRIASDRVGGRRDVDVLVRQPPTRSEAIRCRCPWATSTAMGSRTWRWSTKAPTGSRICTTPAKAAADGHGHRGFRSRCRWRWATLTTTDSRIRSSSPSGPTVIPSSPLAWSASMWGRGEQSTGRNATGAADEHDRVAGGTRRGAPYFGTAWPRYTSLRRC